MTADAPRLVWLDEAASTNSEARDRAQAGERGPVWIAARRQAAGRGRRGRAWTGLDGNLFATGLFTLQCDPARAAELSFAAALAVAEVCDSASGNVDRTRLKWPNDVLFDGRKMAGILLESGQAPGGGLWLAVGIGLNLTGSPTDVERPAISLREAGIELDREAALESLAAAFDRIRLKWLTQGFGVVRDLWLARAYGLGERCEARLSDETLKGVFADLGPDGAMRLDLDTGGRRYISAGDVFFPDSPTSTTG